MGKQEFSITNTFLKNLWRWKCGMDEVSSISETPQYSIENLKQSEWSKRFEKLMRNRLIFGAYRYGLMNAPGKVQYSRVESMKKRLEIYQKTGNKELLVDVANLSLLEFEECNHQNAHFSSIDDGEHVKIKKT